MKTGSAIADPVFVFAAFAAADILLKGLVKGVMLFRVLLHRCLSLLPEGLRQSGLPG